MAASSPYMAPMHSDDEYKRLHWRAHHRGTREADRMIGGFFDAHGASWGPEQRAWFAELLEEQDVDIMAWAIGTQKVPERFAGPEMSAMQQLDYMPIAR
jgi:antitoxin CptB